MSNLMMKIAHQMMSNLNGLKNISFLTVIKRFWPKTSFLSEIKKLKFLKLRDKIVNISEWIPSKNLLEI